jgi:thioredoxin-related protein
MSKTYNYKFILLLIASIIITLSVLSGVVYLINIFFKGNEKPNQVQTKQIQVYDKEFGDMEDREKGKVLYEEYSPKNVDFKGLDRSNIYFFTSNGCITCKDFKKKILEDQKLIISNTSIFEVDIDLNKSLIEKYKIIEPGTVLLVNYADKSEAKRIAPSNPLYPNNLKELIKFGLLQ